MYRADNPPIFSRHAITPSARQNYMQCHPLYSEALLGFIFFRGTSNYPSSALSVSLALRPPIQLVVILSRDLSMNPMSTSKTTSSSSSSSSSKAKAWVVHGLLAGAAIAVAIGARAHHLSRSGWFRSRVIGIIPARFASSRFQGKPLVHILGKPMIQRTWERAKLASSLDYLVVATDDEKIAECCRGFGANVIMTSESCRNGTERCNEALQKLDRKYDIVVNIQGDEPLIEPEIIDGIVKALQAAPDAVCSTAVTSMKPEDAFDPNRVKCIVDNSGYAIYFSRGLIPFNRSGKVNPRFPYLLHLGIQSFDAKFLRIYPKLQDTPLQLEEDLEQLKVLENGYKMKVIKVDHEAHGVDAPEDVDRIEAFMRERNLC